MADIERLTITLPADMARLVKGAVDEGDYASSSEVIREALRDWKMKRQLRLGPARGAEGRHRPWPCGCGRGSARKV